MKEVDKIRYLLKGIDPLKSGKGFNFENVVTGISDPPAYMVQFLAFVMKFYIKPPVMEKVTWVTYIRYKKHDFMIRDYKFGSWSIETDKKDESTIQLAKEIITKISRASKFLDKPLSKALRSQVEKNNFYLNNSYHKLNSFYKFFQERLLESIKDFELAEKQAQKPSSSSKTPLHGLIGSEAHITEYFEKKIGYAYTKPPVITSYTFSLMSFFYSLLDFLFNAIYAFEGQKIKFTEFKKMRWEEKFRLLFPVDKNGELNAFFSNFVKIKREYRNPLTHGLSDDTSILIPFPKIGLIPTSYEYLSHKIHFSHVHITKDEARWIMDNFNKFLQYLEKNDPYRYYFHYIEYGFSIPMLKKAMSELKSRMTSFEEFKDYMEGYAKYQEMIMNMEL